MAKPFTALHDDVLPYLPGAPVPLVDSAIRKATREFLRRTTVLRQEFTFTTTPGIDTYRLNPASGQVSSVLAASLVTHLVQIAWEDVLHQNRARMEINKKKMPIGINEKYIERIADPRVKEYVVKHRAEFIYKFLFFIFCR